MRGIRAGKCARAAAIAAGLALAGCSSVDDALFGGAPGGSPPPSQVAALNPASQPAPPPPPPSARSEAPAPDVQEAPPPVNAGEFGPRIAAISIAPGSDTGTDAGKKTQDLREQVRGIETKLMTNARQLGQLRASNQRLKSLYQTARKQVETGVQANAKPGDSTLVEHWNAAQNALDQLAGNLNATAGIGAAASTDTAATQKIVQDIQAASSTPGVTDEDHRQLDTLEDETRQIGISVERLRKDVANDVPRDTAFLTSERNTLSRLQNAIRNGGAAPSSATSSAPSSTSDASAPVLVIKFDQPNVDYQKPLFAALSDALKARPQASFEVVGIAPTGATAAAMQAAQAAARKHATDVVQTMASMGVPAGRVTVASRTDPSAQSSEVRIFAR